MDFRKEEVNQDLVAKQVSQIVHLVLFTVHLDQLLLEPTL